MRNRNFIEVLERRQLLAGVTVFLPAYNGGIGNWIASAITGITADLGGSQNVPQYLMTIAPNSDGTLAIQSVTHVSGSATPQANNPGDILLTVDNSSIGTNPAYPPPLTAALVTNYMENTPIDGVTLADLPISLISTSIGTAMTDAIAQTFDTQGIWVNQETYMDPDPDTSAPFNDPLNAIYDNVEFADDYWRQNPDGSNTDTEPSGHPIDGAYNLELTWVQNDFSTFALAHLAPPAWYVGTIDPSLIGTSDGQGTILPDWYENGNPPANSTGFLYTLIGGGTRPTSGLWAASGGSGARTSVTHSGLQWPNVSDVATTSTSIASGATLNINYIHQDQSQTDSITFDLDTDQNPYDGAIYSLGTQTGLASSTSIANGSYAASLAGVAPGTYYIVARATDASGLQRYYYSEQQITVTAPVVAPPISITNAAHSNPSTVTGSTTHLIAAGTDTEGGTDLKYTWTFTHLPAGAGTPTIYGNGTNAAQKVAVQFYKQGGYRFTCTITDSKGDTTTSDGTVSVVQRAAKLVVTPVNATVPKEHKRLFSASATDQFGRAVTSAPEFSIVSGPASIGALTGVFAAFDTRGTVLIQVEDDGLTDMLDAFVVN
jgi:hypothetical protein